MLVGGGDAGLVIGGHSALMAVRVDVLHMVSRQFAKAKGGRGIVRGRMRDSENQREKDSRKESERDRRNTKSERKTAGKRVRQKKYKERVKDRKEG